MVHTQKNLFFYKNDVMSTVVVQEIIFIILFIYFYFWLCLAFVATRELSRVAASQASSPVVVHGLLPAGASPAAEPGLQAHGLR